MERFLYARNKVSLQYSCKGDEVTRTKLRTIGRRHVLRIMKGRARWKNVKWRRIKNNCRS